MGVNNKQGKRCTQYSTQSQGIYLAYVFWNSYNAQYITAYGSKQGVRRKGFCFHQRYIHRICIPYDCINCNNLGAYMKKNGYSTQDQMRETGILFSLPLFASATSGLSCSVLISGSGEYRTINPNPNKTVPTHA